MNTEQEKILNDLISSAGKDELLNQLNKPIKTKEQEMEEFFLECLNGLTIKVSDGGDTITYYKGDEWYFEQNRKNDKTYVRNKFIWSVFESKFNLYYKEICVLVKSLLEKYTNWCVKTPQCII